MSENLPTTQAKNIMNENEDGTDPVSTWAFWDTVSSLLAAFLSLFLD